ncbi:RING finger protein 141-like [Cylas formicarius]|uniref:RING finger protein 141-like n=1 Tax=Cylas formicarius TaxID=197179 RepID=UPI002958B27D|nr:RING finger protein 141-like [Cylas formicarius]
MGGATSGLGETFSRVLNDEPIFTLLSEEINNLSYEDLLKLLSEMNHLSKKCLDSNGHQLVFMVKKETDSTIFWRATIQIACVKINADTQEVVSYRLLSLSQFMKIFKTLSCQNLAAEHSQCCTSSNSEKLNISKILDNINESSNSHSSEECCICFERKQELTLPCAHSYCLQCIEEWNEAHDTCPICRERLQSRDESWIISEVPKAEDISKEIRDNLLELADDKPSVCSPS